MNNTHFLATLPGLDPYQARKILDKTNLVSKDKLFECEKHINELTLNILDEMKDKLFMGQGAGGLVMVKINGNNFIVDINTDLQINSDEAQDLFLRLIRTAQEDAFDKLQEYQIKKTKRILTIFERILDDYINEKS